MDNLDSQGNRAKVVHPFFPQGARVLFQGDSITDGNRGRNDDSNHILGHGYVFLIAAKFGSLYPERQITFLNRGVSANKLSHIVTRWQTDTIDLKPDLLSLLSGINDTDVSLAVYEMQYDQLLQETVAAFPHIRIVLCEPFTLPVGWIKEQWTEWRAKVQARQDVVARLGAKYNTPVVKLQGVFEDACKRAPADYWIWDGIHPTYSGHQLIADEWVRTVEQFSQVSLG